MAPPGWRVFPAARTGGAAAGDAAVLNFLADAGFAAERLAAPQPVSVLDRQDVLVTGCELDRLAAVMCVRPSIFEVWAFCTGRKTAADAARAITEIRRLSDTLATRAHDEFRAVA